VHANFVGVFGHELTGDAVHADGAKQERQASKLVILEAALPSIAGLKTDSQNDVSNESLSSLAAGHPTISRAAQPSG
jgi:hypothetical protein